MAVYLFSLRLQVSSFESRAKEFVACEISKSVCRYQLSTEESPEGIMCPALGTRRAILSSKQIDAFPVVGARLVHVPKVILGFSADEWPKYLDRIKSSEAFDTQ